MRKGLLQCAKRVGELPSPSNAPAQAAPQRSNRRARRRVEVFNRHLARKLAQVDMPVTIETLPDGGVHVTVKKTEETSG